MRTTYTVAKPFQTANRRFAVGDPVRPIDIAGLVPFSRWKELGHIVADVAETADEPPKAKPKAKVAPPAAADATGA